MKKAGLFLLAVVMMSGLAGCNKEDDTLDVADLAGTYTPMRQGFLGDEEALFSEPGKIRRRRVSERSRVRAA
jgi:hypothetical protein